MFSRTAHRGSIAATALALVALMLAAPMASFAAPAPTLEEKKAEEQKVLAELEQTRVDLSIKIADYLEACQELERVRAQVSEVSTQIAQMDVSLLRAEDAVTTRAIQLYRTDRLSMLQVLLESASVKDLVTRTYYLVLVNERDADLITQVRQARAESLWLQDSLSRQMERLTALQIEADAQREKIESDMEAQEAKALEIGADIADLIAMENAASYSGSDPNGDFSRDYVVSDANFRAVSSMTVTDIQAFLDDQPGMLKSYRAKDHNGKTVSVAEMIYEAATEWNVSSKVILVTLQKEQSLLSQAQDQHALDWAMGCGATDSGRISKYEGFGNQIWYGTKTLDHGADGWSNGVSMTIDDTVIHPVNSSTYSLYRYTPHFRGNQSFWMIYWRYFGDPLAG